MPFRLAIITLTMLGCTVHSQSTYVEYGGGQRDARPRRPHAATAPRAGTKPDTSRRRPAAADETRSADARNQQPAPPETATATDRHQRPATLGHARTGVPVSASGSDARDGGADKDSIAKQAEHAPVAGAAAPKDGTVRQADSRKPATERRIHQSVQRVAGTKAKPAHESAGARVDREPTLSTRAEAPVAGSKKGGQQQTVSTDAAYKKVLRNRDERLLDDPKTAKLKAPDERVQ